VVQRGNNRVDCFVAADDRRRYLFLLAELATKFECLVHAYCLMSNHVHLLITPLSAPMCSAMMRELGQRYTRYFNRRYARTGTLWEGRYRSCLVETARYVIGCYRYVELNPVKPGIVDDPAAYEWSSHAANIGRRIDPLLTPHAEFLALGLEAEARRRAYRELIRQNLDAAVVAAIRKATHGGLKLGS
jgi:putative transposase